MRVLHASLLSICLTGCAQILGIDHEYELMDDAAPDDERDADMEQDGGSPEVDAGSPGDDAAEPTDTGQPTGFDCQSVAGTVFAGHCYFVIAQGTGLVWSRAKTTCEEFSDAHLVSITSAEEQAAIEAAFFPATVDHWVGLSLAGASTQTPPASCKTSPGSCPFLWASGESLSFTYWARRSASDQEPNYTGACVRLQLTDKRWADHACGTQLPAICEHD